MTRGRPRRTYTPPGHPPSPLDRDGDGIACE
ncbi:excalibur calcium-binding domain-containing protein [Mycobacterium sp. URHB0021]